MSVRSLPSASVLDRLRTSPLFAELDDATLAAIATGLHRERWPGGRSLACDDVAGVFHVLLSGRVKLMRSNAHNGRVVTLFLLEAGDGFDVVSLLDGRPHEMVVEVVEACDLVVAPVARVREWIARYPAFNRGFLPYLGRQMRGLEDRASDLALYDTETRLARLILAHIDGEHGAGALRLINDLPHKALAEMIGSVRVVVNRHLQAWKREGLVSVRRGRLLVERLEALAHRYGDHGAHGDRNGRCNQGR